MLKIHVTNFQSIKDIELEVSGLTVLTAPTHSGKSSIVRAMDALMTARWYQNAYMRDGATLSTITLSSAVHTLEFSRKGSTTTYKIDGESFGKIGRKVTEALTLAGFGEVQVTESATDTVTILPQIQNQFDGPYQDTIPPAALTQLVGAFTNLAPYQTAQEKAKKQQAEARREVERVQKERVKTSAIVNTFTTYTPELAQSQLETALSVYTSLQNVCALIPTYQTYAGVQLALKKVTETGSPFGADNKVYVYAKKFINVGHQVAQSATFFTTHSTILQGLAQLQRQLIQAYPKYAKPVASIVSLNASVATSGAKFIELVQQTVALTQIRSALGQCLPQANLRKFTKELTETSFSIRYLSGVAASHAEELGRLLEEKKTAEATSQEISGRRHTLSKACEDGLCPLCLNALN